MEDQGAPMDCLPADSHPARTMEADRKRPNEKIVQEDNAAKRRKLFGDCRLIEIIHLHDCLRGALSDLRTDVEELTKGVVDGEQGSRVSTLERRVAGRFQVIWSVFSAHSKAEDEFIWPALKKKTSGSQAQANADEQAPHKRNAAATKIDQSVPKDLVQADYEEDHETEERMFSEMDRLLATLRDLVADEPQRIPLNTNEVMNAEPSLQIASVTQNLSERTQKLSQHLMVHLEKEENECLPLVIKHLSKPEIHDLVGQIMGKRSADMIAQIMTMAVQNLAEEERQEMVMYMKESMSGTFFDNWLAMSGWTGENEGEKEQAVSPAEREKKRRRKVGNEDKTDAEAAVAEASLATSSSGAQVTSQAELSRLIKAIATNQSLTAEQKTTTMQGLRDSVWRNNQRVKEGGTGFAATLTSSSSLEVDHDTGPQVVRPASLPVAHQQNVSSLARRITPPSAYYKKGSSGNIELVWSVGGNRESANDGSVPLFSASEMAPTYHDGAARSVLGCPHYSRACKLRHPKSGRLYTCRLCCEQDRELPTAEKDEPLDRYAVAEVMCMKCNTLQPSEDRCINVDCEAHTRPFAKYFCKLCHLYDDSSRPIFHCPYCNTCRLGKGLGIDFRHCMRCNACVSLEDENHQCIPQKLQGSCPICNESLFSSTEALRGLNCGHVMHLSCYTEYRRDHSYTCPLCKVSMENMSDYFAMLDAAIRMQPMPAAYLSTMSNIYCQDCRSTGQVQFHFVGQKCGKCGSYNTRELGRVQVSPRDKQSSE